MPPKREPTSPAPPEGQTAARSRRDGGSPDADSSAGARERILDAAKQLFASRGFDATPTKEIAWQAGVPSGLVFYYFPTKRSLLLAIVKERGFLPALRAALQAEMVSHVDPRAELTAVGLRMVEFLDGNQELMRILVHEAISHPEVAAELRGLRAEGVRLVEDYLREEIRLGRLHPAADVEVVARLFAAGVLVGVLDEPGTPLEEIRRIVDELLRGLVVEGSA